MDRAFTNLLSQNVEVAAGFYQQLLGMKRHFESDWFIILVHPNMPGFELGILAQDHEIVPNHLRGKHSGLMLTFVMADVDNIHLKAQKLGADILQAPTDMPYGQRRLLLMDLDGVTLDVSAPVAPVLQTQ